MIALIVWWLSLHTETPYTCVENKKEEERRGSGQLWRFFAVVNFPTVK